MSGNKSSPPTMSGSASQTSSPPPHASSPWSTPSKGGALDSGTTPKTPGSTPRHRRNRAQVSKFDVSKALSGLTFEKAKSEDTGTKDSDDDDDDVFSDKAIKTANEQATVLFGYNLNSGEMGGPQHGIAVRDFAYEPRS